MNPSIINVKTFDDEKKLPTKKWLDKYKKVKKES
jgi:hypothetical protein